jgi:MFS family permease
MTVAQGANFLEGFEAPEALRTRSFWMLVVAHFCFGLMVVGMVLHMIAYLESLGYKASGAALAMSALFGLGGLGKVIMGYVADRIGARMALAADFAAIAVAFLLVFGAARVLVLIVFILTFGIATAAPVALLPLLVAESLGRRRYGLLAALTGIAGTIGAAAGPVLAGRVFDLTGSYTGAFELFILADAVAALATFVCQSYAQSTGMSIAQVSASVYDLARQQRRFELPARHLRPAGFHPLLGHVPQGILGSEAEDCRRPLSAGTQAHRGMVPPLSACPSSRAMDSTQA